MAEPISFKFEPLIQGGHARVKVWVGPTPDARGLCGELVMRVHEWYMLRWLLGSMPYLEDNERYVPVFARSYAGNVQHWVPIDNHPIEVVPEQLGALYHERIEMLVESIKATEEIRAAVPRSERARR